MVVENNRQNSFWKLAWPACIEGLFLVLLSSIDLIMVSHLNVDATSAVGVFTQIKMVLLCFARSLSVAVTAHISFLYGQQDRKNLSGSMKKAITVTVFGAGILCFTAYLWVEPLLYLAGAKQSYLGLAISYAKPMMLSLFFTSITTVIHGGLLAGGKTKVMMVTNIIGNLLNIGVNAVLIYGLGPFPKMGVAGAAWGTVCGALLTLLLTFHVVLFRKEPLHVRGAKQWMPNLIYLKQLWKKFIGVFTEQSAERIGMFLYSYMSAGLGVLPFAVHTVCMNLCDLYYCFAQGLGKSSLALSGYFCGSKQEEALRNFVRTAQRTTGILSCVACISYIVFREQLILLYHTEPEVIQLGKVILLFVAFVSFPEAQALLCAGILRGAGYTGYVAKYSFLSVAVFRPIMTWGLCYGLSLGLYGAWIALVMDQMIRALCATQKVRKIIGNDLSKKT